MLKTNNRKTFLSWKFILVLRSYCNAQLKIYIDNWAIEINKIIIIIIYYGYH